MTSADGGHRPARAGAEANPARRRDILHEVSRGLFQAFLRLPEIWLNHLAGAAAAPQAAPDSCALDPRARLHARLVARFGAKPAVEPLDPVAARLPSFFSLKLLEGPALPMASIQTFRIPGPGGPLPVRLYAPPACPEPAPALIFLHFGGCVLGDLDTCHTACTILARYGGFKVLSVAYRLAPEHKFPAALEDAVAAFHWLQKEAAQFGIDPERIGIGGDSAGGYLSAATSLLLRDEGLPLPKVQLLIYPVLEMDRRSLPPGGVRGAYPLTEADMEWFAEQYMRDPEDAADPLCSVGRAESLGGMPTTLLIQARHDLLYDEGQRFSERLRAAGVDLTHRIYQSLPHAFTAMSGGIPAAREALIEIATLTGGALRAGRPHETGDHT
jgi:acetyl esterase